MSVPSLISLGAALSLLVGPAVYPVTAPDTAGDGSGNGNGNGNGTLTQVLPLTTSTGDTTEVATGALTLSSSGDGGAAVSPMRQGILSTASDSDWAQNSAILTQPLQVNPFMVTALTWEDGPLPDDMHVYLRVEEGAGWSEWYLVDSDTGTGPDNATGPSGTDPFVTGGAEGIQIRVSGDASELPAGLSLQLIPSDPEGEVKIDEDDVAVTSAKPTDLNEDSQKDAATDAPSGTIPSPLTGTAPLGSDDSAESLSPGTMQSGASTSGSGTGTGQSVAGALSTVFPASTTTNGLPVPVSSRADWGADESYMTWEPTYAAASHVIVHHTAGTNNYTMDQSASVVRGIYYYHAVTMGWGDIGYNFLVDKWGRAFEGRSGSLASTAGQMAVGAHDQGFNTGTMGVSMMGDYSSVTPSQATLDTVGKLASWQLKRAGVDPTGSADFVNVGANSKYPKGSHVNLARISGHRDTYFTECPGDAGYAQLPRIRQIAAATTINTTTPAPPPTDSSTASSNPQGVVDSVRADSATQTITVTGWAFDKDTTNPINVDVYVDSTGTRLTANKSRSDVQRAYGLSTDKVGFSATIPASTGTHSVCIAAINTGGGTNQWLKCTTLTITSNDPQGVVDSVTADSAAQTITLSGWAFDKDTTNPINVDVYVDSTGTRLTANKSRSDVQRAYGLSTDKVGFSATIPASTGTHSVCIAAINTGGGTNQWLKCTTLTITSNDPQGVVDSVTADSAAQTITLSGWAFDKDTTNPINVDVYVDSTGTRLTTNKSRSDVQRAYGLSTDKVGFSATIPASTGTHSVCIAAINTGGGTNQWLKCTTLTITSSGFNAGSIMSDAVMFNAGTMDEPAIADFLRSKNTTCTSASDGTACLKDYRTTSSTMSYAYCSRYTGEENESSAHVIAKAASLCGVNPQVLIAMLQKEQGLVTASGSGLSAQKYQKAMGLGCPDSGDCSADRASFAAQVYGAASRLVQYGEEPLKFTYRAGQTYEIAYSTNTSCGSSAVTITNRATAALYNYTPYQPNAAALANLYGTGDSCSSYGNRNLWRNFRDWFGSPS